MTPRYLVAFVLVSSLIAGACGGGASAPTSTATSTTAGNAAATTTAQPATGWKAPADQTKAKEQAAAFQTYGMPDDWANYGESIAAFCAKYGFSCKRTDTDMSSNEEITHFDAERNNPIAVMADIGMLYGPPAESKKVVPADFLPSAAAKLPASMKAKSGGWFGTFVGVPAWIVNTDVVKNVPRTWSDLLKPEYKGKIGMSDPRTSGTGATTFIAMAFGAGGTENDLQPGVEYAKKLYPNVKGTPKPTSDNLEKGELPIQLAYDFNLLAKQAALKKKGVNTEVVIPTSIYAPSALMINGYHTAKMDLAKLFSEWVLSDEGQTVFAKFGARPVRYVTGDLKLADDAKAKWLPDSAYAQVKQVGDWSKVDPAKIADLWDSQVIAGS